MTHSLHADRRHACAITALTMISALTLAACSASPDVPSRNAGSGGIDSGGTGGDGATSGSGGSGGLGGQSGVGGVGGTAGSGAGAGGDAGESCADADVQALPRNPTVWIVVDGTSQPTRDINGTIVPPDIWETEREALLGDNGIAQALDNVVRFGLVILDVSVSAACPAQIVVPPALHNRSAMDAAYAHTPEPRSTNAARTLQAARDQVASLASAMQTDPTLGPQAVIFSRHTDGGGVCQEDVPPEYGPPAFLTGEQVREITRALMVEATQAMVDDGARFYVFGTYPLPGEVSTQELLADIGNTGHGPFPASDAPALVATLRTIIAEVISCDVTLNGRVTVGEECRGYVEVDGARLPCNSDDGWRLTSPNTVTLTGQACLDFKANPTATLTADFPCEYFEVPD